MSRRKGQVFSADYYYTKALDYLSSLEDNASASAFGCTCSSEADDSSFSLDGTFRPGLPQDDGNASRRSSYSGSDVVTSDGPSRRFSDCTKPGSCESGRQEAARAKRKLSDGHVHWADEFQKELTRCHPRKSYTRHPSLHQQQMKPILKCPAEGDSAELSDPDDKP